MSMLRACYTANMRFFTDDCDYLIPVHWYFVDRDDFVGETVFGSSYFDEEPAIDGNPVGEMIDGRTPRKGDIPAGTVIAPTPLGTPEQWQGQITLADRVKGSTVGGVRCVSCFVGTKSWILPPACGQVAEGMAWNAIHTPALTINGQAVAMTLGPNLPGLGPCLFGTSDPTLFWAAQVPQDLVTELTNDPFLTPSPFWIVWGAQRMPEPPCYQGVLVACWPINEGGVYGLDPMGIGQPYNISATLVLTSYDPYTTTWAGSISGWNTNISSTTPIATLPLTFSQAQG